MAPLSYRQAPPVTTTGNTPSCHSPKCGTPALAAFLRTHMVETCRCKPRAICTTDRSRQRLRHTQHLLTARQQSALHHAAQPCSSIEQAPPPSGFCQVKAGLALHARMCHWFWAKRGCLLSQGLPRKCGQRCCMCIPDAAYLRPTSTVLHCIMF